MTTVLEFQTETNSGLDIAAATRQNEQNILVSGFLTGVGGHKFSLEEVAVNSGVRVSW